MKKLLFFSLVCVILASFSLAEVKHGKHVGELKCLQIKMIYLNPSYYTEDQLPGFQIRHAINYEVRIKNNSARTFQHLNITAIQEYYESGTCNRYWYPYPLVVTFSKGEPLPGDSTDVWRNRHIGPGEEIVLTGTYTIPLETASALGQTHLIIKHTTKGRPEAAQIYNEPEAGVFYLKAPGRRRR